MLGLHYDKWIQASNVQVEVEVEASIPTSKKIDEHFFLHVN